MSMEILKGIHRRALGLSHNDQVMGRGGFVAGGEGKPVIVLPGPDTVALFDDFLGDLVAGEWIAGSSDTGQAANTGVLATSAVSATNGVYRMTSSASSTQTPAGGAQSINGPPNWKPNQGRVRFGARVKIADLAKNNVTASLGGRWPARPGLTKSRPLALPRQRTCTTRSRSNCRAWTGTLPSSSSTASTSRASRLLR
jgi:hypothetical protein